MYRKSGKIFHANVHIGISVLLLSLFTLPSLAASLSISSNGDIGSTNTSQVYTINLNAPDYAPTASGNLRVGSVNEIRYDTIFISDGIDTNIFSPDNTSITLIANGDINIAGSLNWSAGRLSLISIAGDFNLSGSIAANSVALSAGTIGLANSGGISLSSGTLISNRDIQLVTDGGIVLSTVPVPPAVWLFSSGLLGLMGVSRRNQSS